MFDIIVVGAGPGGYCCAIRAAQLGGSVAVVEQKDVGGTCLNRGCIPTKALIESAEALESIAKMREMGIEIPEGSINVRKAFDRKRRIVSRLRGGVEGLLSANGVELYRGRGYLTDAHTVRVTDAAGKAAELRAKSIVLAPGSIPFVPPIPGAALSGVITSDEALSLAEAPRGLVVIGGGVIGVELAGVFAGMGSRVAVVELLPELLPMVDSEITALLRKKLEKRGVTVMTSAKTDSIESDCGELAVNVTLSDGSRRRLTADRVLIAAGRAANTRSLGLEAAGIETRRRRIEVNDRLQTSVPNIYAIGDAIGSAQLAHVAMAEGVVAAENAMGASRAMDYRAVPACIYTSPEIAGVGKTSDDFKDAQIKPNEGRFPISANGRALTMGESEGLVKLLSDAQTGRLLGASLYGPHATEMIGEISVALQLNGSVSDLANTIHPHPTVSEAIGEAACDALGRCIHLPPKGKHV